ncbi:hypothetical protein WN51_00734, partial [Melipona quadrifasciata]
GSSSEFGNGSGVRERSSGDFGDWRCVSDWSGCDFGNGSGVGDWSGGDFSNGSGVGDGSGSDFCYWSSGDDRGSSCFFADYGVKSIYWISDVIDYACGSVSLNKGVAALDDISVTGLLLALGVAGQTVVNVVSIAVLRMGVEVGVDGLGYHSLSHGGSCHC